MTAYKGVLLDVDGTLIDSNDAHAAAWVQAMHEHGHEVAFERVRRLIGKGGDKVLPEVCGVEKSDPEGEAMNKRRSEIFKETGLPTIKPFPQARELLSHMRKQGLKLVVASSASGDELASLLDVANVRDLLQGETSSSDAKESKPDPDIIQAALKKMGFDAREVVMLGDTPYDIEAAAKAGVATIAFTCGGWNEGELGAAIAVYRDPADMLAQFNGSPLGAKPDVL
ncbi:MAG: HAD family hydrolase [Herpetosiphon sp.]